MTYGDYRFSVPKNRARAVITYPGKQPDAAHQYAVTGYEAFSESLFVEAAARLSGQDRTVAVFIHGYNYSYQEALYQTAQLAADARTVGAPVVFSWPSAASITGYVADRDAVLYSRSDLSHLIEALSASAKIKRIMLFGHSMGGSLTMEAVRQLKLSGHERAISKVQIVLAAPDEMQTRS
jgi:esterase/lipase superfamily enzyme